MKVLENIISFLKKLFYKEKNIKMLTAPVEIPEKNTRNEFLKSLRIEKEKKKVETLICNGDGLGIQTKMRR